MNEEKITQWFINTVNGTPSEEQLALIKVYQQQQRIEKAMLEISNECENCKLREKCIEDNCIVFRIEKILSLNGGDNVGK